MKILYVSQYFPPEMGAPSARVAETAKYWAGKGHKVTILTGFPNHPTGELFPKYKDKFKKGIYVEKMNDCRVVRTWLLTIPNGTSFERVLSYISFFVSATVTGSRLKDFDIVIATSPQLLCGLAGYIIGLIKRKPFVLEVRDLWPESLVGSRIGREKSFFIRILDRIARMLYSKSNHIVVVTGRFKKELTLKKGIDKNKISIIENGIETDIFRPLKVKDETIKKIGSHEKFVVSYIGTHGFAHGLEVILESANILKDKKEIKFLLVGEGARKINLKEKAKDMNIKNVEFLDFQPKELIPQFINISDICMVLLRNSEIFKTVLPTKMLEFMSCGKPVILGVDGQAREIMEKANAGIFITPESVDELTDAIIKLKENAKLREKLGRNGREFILRNYTRQKKSLQYLSLLRAILH
jgi:colanic acid biosynthesis glycosyl transferase WcaI